MLSIPHLVHVLLGVLSFFKYQMMPSLGVVIVWTIKKKSNGILIICNQRLLLSALGILKACMSMYISVYISRRNTEDNYNLLTFGIKMSAGSVSGSDQDDCLPVSDLQRQLH